jgi:hypothetical protein
MSMRWATRPVRSIARPSSIVRITSKPVRGSSPREFEDAVAACGALVDAGVVPVAGAGVDGVLPELLPELPLLPFPPPF